MSNSTYTIICRGRRVPVSKDVYQAYHRHRERERYLCGQAADCERSLEQFSEDGVSVEYQYAMSRPSLEDDVHHKTQLARLRQIVCQLDRDEQLLLTALYVQGKSERSAAAELGMSQRTLHDKKKRILGKLHELLKI